uniref:Copia protein n=1 Tax=Cajanus cajan TaxID=3821 RepID=A0A151U162_CAJCA|nr:Copia protein [Cajanus cajan]
MQAARRILRYLKGAPGLGLFYSTHNDHNIQAFSDSDWATCQISRKSITGYCVFFGKSLISWKSKKQSTVSRSSTEAEYRALASLACELQWIKYLCDDLCLNIQVPFCTFSDSESAIQLAKNPSFHERTKHIEVDCHLIRIKIQDGLILLSHVPSSCQLANCFTKALYPNPFHQNVYKLGLVNIYDPP